MNSAPHENSFGACFQRNQFFIIEMISSHSNNDFSDELSGCCGLVEMGSLFLILCVSMVTTQYGNLLLLQSESFEMDTKHTEFALFFSQICSNVNGTT